MFPRNPKLRRDSLKVAHRQQGRVLGWLMMLIPVITLMGSAVQAQSSLAAAPETIPATPLKPSPNLKLPPFQYARAAQPMPKSRPGERPLLTVERSGWRQGLTWKQLLSFPVMRYETYHPQLRQTFTYEGVTLRDLAKYGGFLGRDLRVHASNGFVSTIKAQDYLNEPIMLAYQANGQRIPVLEKGPLTVVLPREPERFSTPQYSAVWVWFAIRITPVP